MPSKYCLLPELATKFKKMLKEGKINPEELASMTSEQRRKYFESFLGENNAKNVNILFESKLLNKNREQAMINWAKEVTGIKPAAKRDLVSKIEKMVAKGDVLTPAQEEAFLQDLAASKLGVDVSYEEAQKITQLSGEISKAKESAGDFKDYDKRVEYGNKLIDMYDYVNSLKPSPTALDTALSIANVPRALMSSMDLSAPGRQGWGMVSRKQFWLNLSPMVKSMFKESAYREIQADIISRPTYQSMKRAGLRLTNIGDKLLDREDEFMTNLLDKVPGIKGSERAYTGFLSKLRADVYDELIRKAQLAGEDVAIGSKTTKDIADVVNNFTGAGKISKLDQSVPILNALFFSPRKIAATMQILNPVKYLNPKMSPTARKASLRNLLGMVGASSAIVGLAVMAGAESESDPRSADFGKVKIGDTRIDVTGGNANYAVLLARLMTNATKSTTSDVVTELGGGYGKQTRGDVLVKYFRNKLSPTASFVGDWLYGTDAIGNPFDVKKEMYSRVMPIIMSNTIETAMSGDTQGAATAALFDFFGMGSNTYSNTENWNGKTTKEMTNLKSSLGQEKFDALNEEYNKKINPEINKLKESEEYKKATDEQKTAKMAGLKKQIKAQVITDAVGGKPSTAKKLTKTDFNKILNSKTYKDMSKEKKVEMLKRMKERM